MIPQMMSVPPPPVLAQLSDLISFFRDMDKVGDLIKQLQTATADNNASLELLEGAKVGSQALADELAAKQKELGDKEEALNALQASLNDKDKRFAETEANLNGSVNNFQAQAATFQAFRDKEQLELASMRSQQEALLNEAMATRDAANKMQAEIQAKSNALAALMGTVVTGESHMGA